ncbi:MAG TPA: Ku protein [Thermoanaerobaculia bacterium]|nr:Ku protein [Thermoanaerobaculia bacterium]
MTIHFPVYPLWIYTHWAMGVRAMGTGMISFGLVTIPVKLYSASQTSESISFNLLHQKCGSRMKQQYVCLQDDEIVERADMVKGYEFSKGEYVTFTEEELKSIQQKKTESIDIIEFVEGSKIDPVYYDKAYYLGPDRGGDKAYHLLSQAMIKTGRWAVARYGARGKNYLVLLRPIEGGIVMQQLLYSYEVRPFSELELGDVEVREQELKMAVQLAELGATDNWNPAQYKDDSHEKLQELIQKKISGQEISVSPEKETGAPIIDLMEALRASLERVPKGAGAKLGDRYRKPARRVEADRPVSRKAAPKRAKGSK